MRVGPCSLAYLCVHVADRVILSFENTHWVSVHSGHLQRYPITSRNQCDDSNYHLDGYLLLCDHHGLRLSTDVCLCA